MKFVKKFISLLIIIGILSFASVFGAAAIDMSDDSFTYSIDFVNTTATIKQYKLNETSVAVPSYFQQFKVVGIEKSAFAGKDNIESVLLPLTIESIGESAFEGCASLEYFSVPSSVKRLGVSVCKGDTALKKVEFNAPLLTLPAYSFSNCSSLSDVVMSDTVTTIGQAAFSGCTSLKDISYFDHTNRFERIAFYKSGLEEIDINENITAIYDYTFADCANLTGVMIPGTVTYIDPTAFLNDSKLTLKVYYDSYAHHFAQDNGIAYQLISDHEMGDVDRSGSVNVTDVTVLQRYLAEWESFDEEQMILADMTGDDGVDISDATAIQFYIVNH
ncbi:MAG: leucine-rich repeat protein [Ruminococcus sp.]|nr:leucine-rich repeat protein [uncultured Ruminococcus sp.]MBQ1349727.1 leucine-rich repeat protein [Ruminococcus sp.]MBQ4260730.1 leucine-rich repeat protein [Ruminococcus sp.]